MKKVILSLSIISSLFILGSCSSYTVKTFQPDQMNGSDCPTPIYVATMSRTETFIGTVTGTEARSLYKTDQREFTLVSLLEVARKTHGMDVTIHNVRWDVKNGKKKTGVIFDVVRCK